MPSPSLCCLSSPSYQDSFHEKLPQGGMGLTHTHPHTHTLCCPPITEDLLLIWLPYHTTCLPSYHRYMSPSLCFLLLTHLTPLHTCSLPTHTHHTPYTHLLLTLLTYLPYLQHLGSSSLGQDLEGSLLLNLSPYTAYHYHLNLHTTLPPTPTCLPTYGFATHYYLPLTFYDTTIFFFFFFCSPR